MTVVVMLVLAEHGGGVALVDDQDAVEEFSTDRADEAFGDRVGPRCLPRRLMTLMSMAVKTASKATVNLASRSRMRNRNRRPVSSRSMSRLCACWVSQAPVGCAVTPRMFLDAGGVAAQGRRHVHGYGPGMRRRSGRVGVDDLRPRGRMSARTSRRNAVVGTPRRYRIARVRRRTNLPSSPPSGSASAAGACADDSGASAAGISK